MDKVKRRVTSSRAEIDSLALPLETKSYKPVAFGHVVDALDDALTQHLDELTDLGYTDTKSTYFLNPKKTQMRYERSFHQPQGLLGIRAVAHTSSDKTMPIEYGAEGEVGVCSNGMVATQWQYVSARRHTRFRHLEYGMAANEAIQNLGPFIQQLEVDKATMVERTLSDDEFYGFMGRTWGHKVIGSNAINDVAKEWQNPRHDEFLDRNMWSAYNATTEVMKASPFFDQRERMNQLHKIALTY
jgi:hypothetical protein